MTRAAQMRRGCLWLVDASPTYRAWREAVIERFVRLDFVMQECDVWTRDFVVTGWSTAALGKYFGVGERFRCGRREDDA